MSPLNPPAGIFMVVVPVAPSPSTVPTPPLGSALLVTSFIVVSKGTVLVEANVLAWYNSIH